MPIYTLSRVEAVSEDRATEAREWRVVEAEHGSDRLARALLYEREGARERQTQADDDKPCVTLDADRAASEGTAAETEKAYNEAGFRPSRVPGSGGSERYGTSHQKRSAGEFQAPAINVSSPQYKNPLSASSLKPASERDGEAGTVYKNGAQDAATGTRRETRPKSTEGTRPIPTARRKAPAVGSPTESEAGRARDCQRVSTGVWRAKRVAASEHRFPAERQPGAERCERAVRLYSGLSTPQLMD